MRTKPTMNTDKGDKTPGAAEFNNETISLKEVDENDQTRLLFTVAARTDDGDKVLSELDAISYMIYKDRFERCEGRADCECRVVSSDSKFIGLGWNTYDDVMGQLWQLPEAKQNELQNEAKRFIEDARELVKKTQNK